MKPLTVRYMDMAPSDRPDDRAVFVREMSESGAAILRDLIESNIIDEVILIGPGVCTGWRISTPCRDVQFVPARGPKTPEYEIRERQAKHRIIGRNRKPC